MYLYSHLMLSLIQLEFRNTRKCRKLQWWSTRCLKEFRGNCQPFCTIPDRYRQTDQSIDQLFLGGLSNRPMQLPQGPHDASRCIAPQFVYLMFVTTTKVGQVSITSPYSKIHSLMKSNLRLSTVTEDCLAFSFWTSACSIA